MNPGKLYNYKLSPSSQICQGELKNFSFFKNSGDLKDFDNDTGIFKGAFILASFQEKATIGNKSTLWFGRHEIKTKMSLPLFISVLII